MYNGGMEIHTKFLLDSGDPEEYKTIAALAKQKGYELWGSTTNPSLIAKSASRRISATGKKLTTTEAFALQKEIVLQIIDIVPGAVSAEVYADSQTKALEMVTQGKEIASWHTRVVVKLPTTIEGFKARTGLRKLGIVTNNTLVFSQEQIYAICLHEKLIQQQFSPQTPLFPPFISPFVGRLDDIGIDGISLVKHGMNMKKNFMLTLPQSPLGIWMLEASVRSIEHMNQGIALQTELTTAPAKLYTDWFSLSESEKHTKHESTALRPLEHWNAPENIESIKTLDEFMNALESGSLNISHDLTEKGIERFTAD